MVHEAQSFPNGLLVDTITYLFRMHLVHHELDSGLFDIISITTTIIIIIIIITTIVLISIYYCYYVILVQGHAWSAAGIEEAGAVAGPTHACLHGGQVLP